MRTSIIAVLAAAVLVSGCTGFLGGDDSPQQSNTSEDEDNLTRTQDYAGASSDFTSASQRIDYTGNNEVAAKPNSPGESATLAAMGRVPANHKDSNFRDVRLTADYPAFREVQQGDIRNLILDRGVNNTIEAPGSEDFRFDTYRAEVSDNGTVLTVSPGQVRDYNLTTDDRVLLEFTSFRTPDDAGDETVEIEINTEETDTIYEPVRTSLEIRD